MFQNDRGLLLLQHSYDTCYHSLQSPALCVIHLHPPDHIRGTWTHLQELIPSSLTLPLQTMHIVRQEPFQSKDLPLLPVEPGSLVQARVVEQRRTWTSGQAPAQVPISRSGRWLDSMHTFQICLDRDQVLVLWVHDRILRHASSLDGREHGAVEMPRPGDRRAFCERSEHCQISVPFVCSVTMGQLQHRSSKCKLRDARMRCADSL